MRMTEAEYQEFLRKTGQAEEKPPWMYDKDKVLREMNEALDEFDRAQANLEEPGLQFQSKTERRAWEEWIPTTGAAVWFYEPIRLYLNSGSYKPDFVLVMPNKEIHIIEVKGSWNAYQSGRSSKKSIKEAAKLFWWLGRFFTLLPRKGGGWDLEEIT